MLAHPINTRAIAQPHYPRAVQTRTLCSRSAIIQASVGVPPLCEKLDVRPITPKPSLLSRTEGLAQNESCFSKVPHEWHRLLKGIAAAYQQACGSNLVGVYLRGSLPKGFFIRGVSDVDTFALTSASSPCDGSTAASNTAVVIGSQPSAAEGASAVLQQQQQTVKQLTEALCQEHRKRLGFTKIEVRVLTIPNSSPAATVLRRPRAATPAWGASDTLCRSRSTGGTPVANRLPHSSASISSVASDHISSINNVSTVALPPSIVPHIPAAFELKTQSVCLAGLDLPSLLPAAAALPPPVQLLPGLAEDIAAARDEAAVAARRGDIQRQVVAAKWSLKRLLRCASELVQQQSGVWTRDLYWCCHYAGQHLPQLQQQLEHALELYVQLQHQQQQLQQDDRSSMAGQQQQQHELQHQLASTWQLINALLPHTETLFLKQMLLEEPGWLAKHTGGPIPACPCSSLRHIAEAAVAAAGSALQLPQQEQWPWSAVKQHLQSMAAAAGLSGSPATLAAAAAVGRHAAPGASTILLGSRPPHVQIPIWGPVQAYDWCDAWERTASCAHIRSVLLGKDHLAGHMAGAQNSHSMKQQVVQQEKRCHADQMPTQVSQSSTLQGSSCLHSQGLVVNPVQKELFSCHPQPIVLKGLASGWPAVSGPEPWSLAWLSQQGFSGQVRVAPSLQFPFVEPQLVKLLQQVAGLSAAPSSEFNMPAAEFVQRLQTDCQLPPLLYKPQEHYYMQAQLTDQLQEQLGLQHLLQHIRTVANPQCATAADSCEPGLQFSQVPRLWISPAGAVSPLHYDISHSFLVQIRGYKRMLFFSPDQLYRLYCYPETHLLRRRSRVNVCAPDLDKFALFRDVGALEFVLGPGDCVFFPSIWAHYTESVGEDLQEPCGCSMSLTFRLQTSF